VESAFLEEEGIEGLELRRVVRVLGEPVRRLLGHAVDLVAIRLDVDVLVVEFRE
jgi:hypothetical protein